MAGCSIKGRPSPRGEIAEVTLASLIANLRKVRFRRWCANQLIADAFVKVKIKTRLRRKHTYVVYVCTNKKYEQSGVALTKRILHFCASRVRRADHSKRWSFTRLRPDGGKLLQVRSELCLIAVGSLKSCNTFTHTTQMILGLLVALVSIFTIHNAKRYHFSCDQSGVEFEVTWLANATSQLIG